MGTRLYIGHLSYTTTAETLSAAFSQEGRVVKSVEIVTEKETGRPRGFAFVDMATEADAEAAIVAMHGAEVDGWKIQVNEARAKTSRPPGGPGGPGGGRSFSSGGRGRSSGGGGFGGHGGGQGGRPDRERSGRPRPESMERGSGGNKRKDWREGRDARNLDDDEAE